MTGYFCAAPEKEAIATFENSDFSLVLLDQICRMNGIDICSSKQIQPNLLVIIITGFASVESAVEAIKLGAYDYIKKPFKADAIKLIVKLALETQALKERVKQLLQTKPTGLNTILGDSAEILKVKHQILEFAKYDSETVLITGESGTGKELISQALHNLAHAINLILLKLTAHPSRKICWRASCLATKKARSPMRKMPKKEDCSKKLDVQHCFSMKSLEMSPPSLQAKLCGCWNHKTFRRLGGTKDITMRFADHRRNQ
ncbi:MAG: response regulator [Calditrichia bacterium]